MVEIVAVQQQGQQRAAIDSRTLAEAMGNEHRATLQLIKSTKRTFKPLASGSHSHFKCEWEPEAGIQFGL